MTRLSTVIIGAVLTAGLTYMLVARFAEIQRQSAVRDSIAYWSAGRLLVDHQNPYENGAILELERQHGYQADRPLVLRTPPWSLFLTVPLGFLAPVWRSYFHLQNRICCHYFGLPSSFGWS